MIAYKQIDVAEVCYLDEAAAWIALGRIPEAMVDEIGADVRGDAEHHENRFGPSGIEFYYPTEFAALGAEVDFNQYFSAILSSTGRTVDEYLESARQSRALFEDVGLDGPEVLEQELENVRYIEWAEAAFRQVFDRARVKLLGALMDDNLEATGYRVPAQRDEDPDLLDDEPVPVPANAWTTTGTHWKSRSVATADTEYLLVTLPTARLLELFPTPLVGTEGVEGLRCGHFMITANATAAESVRTRGRPSYGDGVVETGIRNYFMRQLKDGKLPDKAEAVLAEATAFAEAIFEVKRGRSTVQRYLQPVLEAMSKNRAHKSRP